MIYSKLGHFHYDNKWYIVVDDDRRGTSTAANEHSTEGLEMVLSKVQEAKKQEVVGI
ncbi:MAG: hypothetical protein OXH57_12120 [Ekhidna sp.]|nr:hypothetical protein [Ekhidna sp.]